MADVPKKSCALWKGECAKWCSCKGGIVGCGRGASMLSMVKSGAGGRSGIAPPSSSAVLSSAGASRDHPPPAPPMPLSLPWAPRDVATLTAWQPSPRYQTPNTHYHIFSFLFIIKIHYVFTHTTLTKNLNVYLAIIFLACKNELKLRAVRY